MDDKAGKESSSTYPNDSDTEQYGLAEAIFAGLAAIADAIRYHADRTGDGMIDPYDDSLHNDEKYL